MTTLINVSSSGPYGIVAEADKYGQALVIKDWARLPNGKFGPIQKHGGVNIGDILVAINDVSLQNTSFSDAKTLLNKNMSTKVLKFMKSSQYYKEKKIAKAGKNSTAKQSGKVPFMSMINRSRINNFASTKFAEYEVCCQLRLASLSVGKEKTFKWSVWKRYSDFEQLHKHMKQTQGWHMDNIAFPSAYTFSMSKLSPEFIEQRRVELNEYWQKVIAIDKVAEFSKHHCSAPLKAFIDVDAIVRGDKTSSDTTDAPKENGDSTKDDSKEEDVKEGTKEESSNNKKSESTRRASKRLSSRQSSNKSRKSSVSNSSSVSSPTSSAVTAIKASETTDEKAPETSPPPPSSTVAVSTKVSAPPPPASTSSSSGSSLPPPATGARMNLLGSINALRKD